MHRHAQKALSDANTLVMLIGTQEAATAAQNLTHYTDSAFFKQLDFSQQQFSDLLWTFILHARAGLVFPDQPDVPLNQVWPSSLADRLASEEEARKLSALESESEAN